MEEKLEQINRQNGNNYDQVVGTILISHGNKSIVKHATNYYLIDGDYKDKKEILFSPQEAKEKYPSLMYLFASIVDDNELSDEQLDMFINVIKKHW